MSQDGELRRGERDSVPTDRRRAFNIENLEKGFQSSIKNRQSNMKLVIA